jgi:NADH-quinone oxidoreductase E subunit
MFSDSLKHSILALQGQFPEVRSAVIPALWKVQEEFGFVSMESCEEVAALFGLPPAEVRGVLTFYTMFYQKPMGRHRFKVCRTLSCWLRGAAEVTACLREKLGIEPGGVTPDKKFSLETVECLGECDRAPAILVNETRHDHVTPEMARKMVEGLK